MSKRTVFTTVTPLPAGISRETVMSTLWSHEEMIQLNPLVEEHHSINPPPNASPEEFHCQWYSLTDRVQYLPGGWASGRVTYNACFHDLPSSVQTHCYAPMGLNIKGKWTLGGTLPGEPIAPVEMGVGVPLTGLYLREDVDMRCNIMMTAFVKKTLKKAHSTLVDRLMVKAQIMNAAEKNRQLETMNYALETPNTDYRAESRGSQDSHKSWGFSKHGKQSPPPNSGMSDDTPSPQHASRRSSIHPSGMSIRSSGSTFNGSQSGHQHIRSSSLQEVSTRGNTNANSNKVLWKNLNGKPPSPQQAQPTYRAENPSRPPPPHLHNLAGWNQKSGPQQMSVPSPGAPPPPPKNIIAELE